MYRITWTKNDTSFGKDIEEVIDVPAINVIVNGLGSDGGILEWLVGEKYGIINYYNQIIAYIELCTQVVKEKEDIDDSVLEEALKLYDYKNLTQLVMSYNSYVEITLAKGEKVEGLLHYISITRR